ncbi:hypothetical protein IAQ61_009392, partial [Plenodomus lingam]|uniref:uncharacterized protein n=1 Tax=Leptosphaeria maculans TaxID=5022 RepID=UPI00331CA1B2
MSPSSQSLAHAMDTQQRALLFGAAAALRLLLFTFFPSLPALLAGRVEVSTPVTSFKRLQEGVFLYTHNLSPYDGGVFHQAPLLLPLFSLLPDPSHAPLATNLLFVVVDLLSANALAQLADSGFASVTRLFASSRKHLKWSSMAIAAGFLFNPFTVATCIARSTSALSNMFILTAMAKASQGASVTFVLSVAFAAYLAMHPILLFPPVLMLLYDARSIKTKSAPDVWSFTAIHSVALAASMGALLSASAFLTGSWDFLAATYGVRLLLPDLTPNVGLWWYFFIEMFDSFREFFLAVFWLHAASYMPGLTIRLYRQPVFVACSLIGVFTIFTPYPSIADAALYLAVVPLFRHLFPMMRYTFLAASSILYTSFLGPAFYHLWIYAGSGNANFFYAITLVWSLGLSVILGDSLYAALRDELDVERPELQVSFRSVYKTILSSGNYDMAGDKINPLSAREMEVLALAWQCMDVQPKIDTHKLASLTGYTPGSASVTMGNIKRKLKILGDSLTSKSGPTTPKKTVTPKSTAGSKRGAPANETPSKRQKSGGRPKQQHSAKDDEDDDEEMTKTEESIKVKKELFEDAMDGGKEDADGAFAMLEGLESFAAQGMGF